jgi:hypothetical protein
VLLSLRHCTLLLKKDINQLFSSLFQDG